MALAAVTMAMAFGVGLAVGERTAGATPAALAQSSPKLSSSCELDVLKLRVRLFTVELALAAERDPNDLEKLREKVGQLRLAIDTYLSGLGKAQAPGPSSQPPEIQRGSEAIAAGKIGTVGPPSEENPTSEEIQARQKSLSRVNRAPNPEEMRARITGQASVSEMPEISEVEIARQMADEIRFLEGAVKEKQKVDDNSLRNAISRLEQMSSRLEPVQR